MQLEYQEETQSTGRDHWGRSWNTRRKLSKLEGTTGEATQLEGFQEEPVNYNQLEG